MFYFFFFFLPPGSGGGMGSNKVSPGEALLMDKARNLNVQSKTNLESREYNQVSQTRVWVKERVMSG